MNAVLQFAESHDRTTPLTKLMANRGNSRNAIPRNSAHVAMWAFKC